MALPAGGRAGVSAIQAGTSRAVTFGGARSVTVPTGAQEVSDPLDIPAGPGANLTVTVYLADGQAVHGVSFALRRGEILGIAGLMGAGRSELAETLCGLRRARRGSVRLKGRTLAIGKYGDALRHGIAYLSEDRKQAGVFLELSVAQNISSMAPGRDAST